MTGLALIITYCFLCCLPFCMTNYYSNCYPLRHPKYVNYPICYVTSISAYDTTLKSIPEDVPALALVCDNFARTSIMSPGVFSRFTSLKSLTIEVCNISLVTSSSFRGLSGLQELLIFNSIVPELASNTFEHLVSLEVLVIVETKTPRLPDISHMTSLRHLNISHNDLREVASTVTNLSSSDSRSSLTLIDLSYNNFTSLPWEVIRGGSSLESIYLKGLPSVTEITFPKDVNLKNMLVLHADNTHLKSVEMSSLETATQLQELHLFGCNQPLNLSGFDVFTRLVELSLNEFGITDSIWSELNSTELTRLDLTNNNLTTVHIWQLPSLRVMRLGENNIAEIAEGTFDRQLGLLLLNMSFNDVSVLPKKIFQGNPNLQALMLDHNKIKRLDRETFSFVTQLFYLDLSYNEISIIDLDVFRDLVSMRFMYLQGNKLLALPTINHMLELNTLNVSYNYISQIVDGEMGMLKQLEIVDASNNMLTFVVPHMVSDCTSLLMLNLQNNFISKVGTFGFHPNLQMIRLDNNSITDFESASPFINMLNLKYLFIDGNKLVTLRPNWFPVSTVSITLGENVITEFFSTSFKNLPNLTTVNLVGNKFAFLMPSYSVNTFKVNSPKPVFEVSHNTFWCTCDMAYLKVIIEDGYSNNVFSDYYPKFLGLDTTFCLTPYENYTERPIADVPLSHFACQYNETFCDILCQCCDSPLEECPCALTCPESCKCYQAGSGFKKTFFHIHCNDKGLEKVPQKIPSRATSVYLDGNSLNKLTQYELAHLSKVEILFLNRSKIENLGDGLFDNCTSLLHLRLDYNYLSSISKSLFDKLIELRSLYLNDNLINFIAKEAFANLNSVEIITLDKNRLIMLDAVYGISSLKSLTLSGNPWQCQCNTSTDVLRVLHALNDIIVDRGNMCCYYVGTARAEDEVSAATVQLLTKLSELSDRTCYNLMIFPYEDLCVLRADNVTGSYATHSSPAESLTLLVCLVVAMFVLLLIAVVVLVIIFKGREVQAWVYVNLGVRVYDKKAVIDKTDAGNKYFDAFISYSNKDSEFVSKVLVPALDEKGYRLCVHYRDFPVGQNITDTIFRAIEESSRTIMLLSRHFVESEWCRFEFQTAHYHILKEGSHRLVFILLDDLSDDELDPDLKVQLKSKTYLKFGDPWFWEKLFFALPDVRKVKDGTTEEDALNGMRILAGEKIVNNNDKPVTVIQADIVL
ncbi:toll-like receptor Tollo [Biomphalaria glabrata]|uniref:Toll-like receptor Tollo n=1 Tax=Biomphalaria glabrata TaxID=6526 RepID=A0A9U8ELW5_BIOGL|nr:toll-like receptor Tollo [Biomphalaria glabrata]